MVPQDFIYFVDLDNFHVCHNLGITSTLACASIAHLESFNEIHPIYSVDPDKLLIETNSIQTFLSPRLLYVFMSCWNRNGLKVGIAMDRPRFYSHDYINRINRIAELEIEFEKVRRKINNDLPSRLMCIYLAEDNVDGRIMLQNMFHRKKSPCIVSVKIKSLLRLHRADSKWIDEYESTKNKLSIENYWKGISFDNRPQYEYLLEGEIELQRPEDREFILQDYILRHVPYMKNDE